ncbi:MAG: helix-turn-helix transcriptional regulator [Anditalea sp.]
MRKIIKAPRILKINWINDLSISVVFNNGGARIIDVINLFKSIGVEDNAPSAILYDPKEFEKVMINNNTLSWNNVEQHITGKDGTNIKVPFEIGADVLLKHSRSEKSELMIKVGQLIRETRQKMGISQQELALLSGTSRTYISRIENDRSDIELATLRKIIETGLGKRLEINIKND